MTNEALKLVQSKQNNGPIISIYTLNIFMDPSTYIMKFIIILKIILHNINFVKIVIARPKNQIWCPKLNVPYF